MGFWTNSAGSIAERMRISSTGKFLVGTTAAGTFSGDPVDHRFDQLTNNAYTINITAANTAKRGLCIYYPAGGTADPAIGFRVDSSWKYILRGDGDCENANNSYGGISDVALKENIVDANSQWNDIKALQFKNYKWKDESRGTDTYLGLIADEVESVSPGLIGIDAISAETMPDDGIDPEYKNVKYSIVWMKAVKALQEAMTKIETLETKLEAAEARIATLEG